MNCLYITLFFNIVACIVQTFIKSWNNQLLYPRVIEVCRQPFELRHDFCLYLIIVVVLFPARCFFRWRNKWKSLGARSGLYGGWSKISHFTFALRNRVTERTLHLAGLWIGAAISNMSHSNKAGSTTVKRAQLTGKGSRSKAVLP